MFALPSKNMVVIGGSYGVGRQIAETAHASGARMLAVAQQLEALRRLAQKKDSRRAKAVACELSDVLSSPDGGHRSDMRGKQRSRVSLRSPDAARRKL